MLGDGLRHKAMPKLLFLTGNRAKLAHARYMAEGHLIQIENIKQRSYNKSYEEPRLCIRDTLLKKSYESALEQAEKAGLDIKKDFFFLEDTSVRIDALSGNNKEVPGVDVKYWMQGKTFEDIDRLLKQYGNNRKATVRSDILLHVPENHRYLLAGQSAPYIIYTSDKEGTICEREFEIKINLVFPWLDDKTFNKWFVPDGASKPMSLLPINQADQYDFRADAFNQMLDFLKGHLHIPRSDSVPRTRAHRTFSKPTNRSPQPVLIVCGLSCAGKTTISQHLAKYFGYIHIEASDFMHWNCYIRHGVNPRINIGDFAVEALKAKPQIVAEKIVEYMEDLATQPVIISGFRSEREIRWFVEHYRRNKEPEIVVIDASPRIRHERYKIRNRNGGFEKRDEQQRSMGLSKIMMKPEYDKIINEGTINEFYQDFEHKFVRNNASSDGVNPDFAFLKDFDGDLKFAEIMQVTLLSRWRFDESREYYTTKGIADICKEIFPALKKPKHKDNISRYFNQDFYFFYEIDFDADENKRKYRLSNTGYSAALIAYNKALQLVKEAKKDTESGKLLSLL